MKNSVRIILALAAVVILLELTGSAAKAQEQRRPAKGEFTFAVYGDSRSMMYLPYKQAEEAEARELVVDMFELVLPAKIARGG
jgi:hypothetical protein